MRKLSTGLSTFPQMGERKAEGKEKLSPTPPIREKQGEKKASRGFYEKPYKPARARVRAYEEAGAAADRLIGILNGSEGDRALWAFYCRHFDVGDLFEKAYELASCHRQGELKNPVRAFQAWLRRTYGKEVR